jgi:hypothetical protein
VSEGSKNNNTTTTTALKSQVSKNNNTNSLESQGSKNNNSTTTNSDQQSSKNITTTTTLVSEGSKNNNTTTTTALKYQVLKNNNTTAISLESQGSKSSNGASMNCLEYEVLLFPRAEFGIGLRVENVNVGVIAHEFTRHPLSGAIMPAEESGMITLGDFLVGLNDVDLSDSSLEEIFQLFKKNRNVALKLKFRRHSTTTISSDVNIGPLTGIQMEPLGAIPTEESSGFEDLDGFWAATEASASTDIEPPLDKRNDTEASASTDIKPPLDKPNDDTETTTESVIESVCNICGCTPCEWVEYGQAVISLMMQAYDHSQHSENERLYDFDTKETVSNETARAVACKCFQYSKFGTINVAKSRPVPKCVKHYIEMLYPDRKEKDKKSKKGK